MKKLFLVTIFIYNLLNISAQNYVDLAKLYYQNTPQNDFDSTSGSTNIQEFGVDLTLPVKLESGNALLTGLSYNNVSFSLDDNTSLALQDVSLKLGISINHSEKFNGAYILLPKLSTDFGKIGSTDFQLGGLMIFKYKKTENFKYFQIKIVNKVKLVSNSAWETIKQTTKQIPNKEYLTQRIVLR
jgi:hypothetical protein